MIKNDEAILSKRVTFPLYFFKGVMGLTVGFYLFTYALLFFYKLRILFEKGDQPSFLFIDKPLEWTAAIFSIGILFEVALEVPTGVFADSLGRKFAIVSSMLVRGFYFLALFLVAILDNSATAILFVSFFSIILFSLHYTLMSGSFVAWVRDALDEEGRAGLLPLVLSRANLLYWAFFMIGSLISYSFFTAGLKFEEGKLVDLNSSLISYLYFLGGGICFFCASVFALYMRENRYYKFAHFSDLFSKARTDTIKKGWKIWHIGLQAFWKDKRLWFVFLYGSTVLSLIYLVDYIWPVFTKERFTEAIASLNLVLVLVFGFASLIGTYIISWLLKRFNINNIRTSGLALFASIVSFLFVLPIFIAVAIFRPESSNNNFVFFIFLMFIHKICHGAFHPIYEGLQNSCIEGRSQERATILSWGAIVQNIPVIFLVFFGAGTNPEDLTLWIIPCIFIIVLSAIMLIYVRSKEKLNSTQATTEVSHDT